MLQGKAHGKGADYWALGVLLFEMCYNSTPFADGAQARNAKQDENSVEAASRQTAAASASQKIGGQGGLAQETRSAQLALFQRILEARIIFDGAEEGAGIEGGLIDGGSGTSATDGGGQKQQVRRQNGLNRREEARLQALVLALLNKQPRKRLGCGGGLAMVTGGAYSMQGAGAVKAHGYFKEPRFEWHKLAAMEMAAPPPPQLFDKGTTEKAGDDGSTGGESSWSEYTEVMLAEKGLRKQRTAWGRVKKGASKRIKTRMGVYGQQPAVKAGKEKDGSSNWTSDW
jgi:hypothetical protein